MTVSGLRELYAGDRLTGRELEMLAYAARGLTSWETGKQVFLAAETVRMYRKMVIAKLNARNIVHAVVLAIHHELIAVEELGLDDPPES